MMFFRFQAALAVTLPLVVLSACHQPRRPGPYSTTYASPRRDTCTAQRLNAQGLQLIEKGQDTEAEEKFRAALEADLFCAPAHNNLGLLLLRSSRAYEAAWEFQFAAKLQPHAVEPRNNLGLVMEKVGQLDQAIEHYEQALEIDPHNVEVMGHLARAYIKSHKQPEDLHNLLKRLSFQNPGGDWDRWARGQLLVLNRGDAD